MSFEALGKFIHRRLLEFIRLTLGKFIHCRLLEFVRLTLGKFIHPRLIQFIRLYEWTLSLKLVIFVVCAVITEWLNSSQQHRNWIGLLFKDIMVLKNLPY